MGPWNSHESDCERMRDIDAINNRITRGFVQAWPEEIILQPNPRIKSASGGWTETAAGEPRRPQRFALIVPGAGRQGGDGHVITVDGQTLRLDYMLIGDRDVEVEIGDTFVNDGKTFRIVFKVPYNGFEVKAGAVTHDGGF